LFPPSRFGCGINFPPVSNMPKGGSVSPGRLAGEAGLSGGRCAKTALQKTLNTHNHFVI
jgi:hypothetical protein